MCVVRVAGSACQLGIQTKAKKYKMDVSDVKSINRSKKKHGIVIHSEGRWIGNVMGSDWCDGSVAVVDDLMLQMWGACVWGS